MASIHTYSVQFRISGKDLDPHEVTRRLGLEPCQIRIAGEKRSQTALWEESLWAFDGVPEANVSPIEWSSLEEGLSAVLESLLPKKKLILAYAASFDVIWWCGHFQTSFDGGPTLSVQLLRDLAAFGAPLYLDNYFVNDDSKE